MREYDSDCFVVAGLPRDKTKRRKPLLPGSYSSICTSQTIIPTLPREVFDCYAKDPYPALQGGVDC
jgi:hypothetical protein